LSGEKRREGSGTVSVELEWVEGGRPVLKDLPDFGVSLSHDERACLCVAGVGPQGCDVAPVTSRPECRWRALVAPNALLLERLDEPLDLAGTRLWAATEAVRKASTVEGAIRLDLERREGDSVLFRGGADGAEPLHVLTFPLLLTHGPDRVVAVVVKPPDEEPAVPPSAGDDAIAALYGYERKAFEMTMTEAVGPNGRPIVAFRFPVPFREIANLSRTAYFSHYTTWMGRVREYGTFPVNAQLEAELSSGRWGMVSNYTETRIFLPLHVEDVVEARLSMEVTESTQELLFDWHRVLAGGGTERVAWSKMKTTWVAILGHGVVEARPAPDYFMEFAAKMGPRPGAAPFPPPGEPVDLGPVVARVPPGPVNRALLAERVFETSLEEANVVGNIYFANYTEWQGPTRDHYFHELAPEYYRGTGEFGELRCLYYRIEHLREAMPFDRIGVRMSVDAVHERGVVLRFEYFRVPANGAWEKLGAGRHEAAWFMPVPNGGDWKPGPLPDVFREPLVATVRAAGA